MNVPARRIACLLTVCVLAGPGFGSGQQSRPWLIAGGWIAVGPNAPFRTRLGTRHHDVYMLGFRAERALMRRGAMELHHTVDILPLAASTVTPIRYDEGPCAGPTPQNTAQTGCSRWVPHWGTIYGFGLVPAGLEARYTAHRALQIVAGATLGALYFTRPMPDPRAARLNFSVAADFGIRVAPGGVHAIDLRYRFQHISNGGTAFNPGMNAHMLRIGLGVW
ncbi:MAG TPA: acyloxyacyl hydrolase [Gemmatimonadales bacterium]|nr:acyloxyacyl hydrolase [Gemmatimonadales bacterium]